MGNRSIRRDRRGVSPVIGAILMLAVAMLALSILQTTAIPALNAQHEFQHNERVQTDVAELASATDRVASTGVGESVSLAVGMRYPPRLFFINPPPVYGTLRTSTPEAVTIRNATATGETGHYWNGDPRTLETRSVRYIPDYNEYDGAPITVYEPWAVYNRFDTRTLAPSDTDLVDGRRISLVTLRGQYNTSSAGSTSPGLRPHSAPVRTVTVSDGSGPLEVVVPTQLRNDTWSTLLDGELASAGGSVAGFNCAREPPEPCGELTLTLVPGTYTLALGSVGLGGGTPRSEPAYLTDVEGTGVSVPESGRQRLVVEARDRYDNPVSGVAVEATLDGDPGDLRPLSSTTDADGRAVFTYEAPVDVDGPQDVTVSAAFGDALDHESVTFDLRVLDLDGSGSNSDSASLVEGVDGSVSSGPVTRGSGKAAQFDISAAETVTITGFTVETRDELATATFGDSGSTFGGSGLPYAFNGETTVDLREFQTTGNLGLRRFVDPEGTQADVLVTFEFADGSRRTFGLD